MKQPQTMIAVGDIVMTLEERSLPTCIDTFHLDSNVIKPRYVDWTPGAPAIVIGSRFIEHHGLNYVALFLLTPDGLGWCRDTYVLGVP